LTTAGTITGEYGVYASGDIGTFINRTGAVVSGTGAGYGFYSSEAVGTFTNEAGGLIESTNSEGVYLNGDWVGTFTNAGTIRSLATDDYAGLSVGDGITTLTNSGTISGSYGISQDDVIGTLTNTAKGLLEGTDSGLYIGDSDPVTVVNHGRITGAQRGVYAYHDLGPLTNKSGGVISGTNVAGILMEDDARTAVATINNESGALITSANGAGILVDADGYDPGTVVNAGTLEGGTAGVETASGGLLSVVNTGTIRYAGAGTGPAVRVGSGAFLGDATGASGPALTSTGTGALLGGRIENQGTIHHGFTIENQSVTVSAGGGTGTFTSGTTNLAANVSVDGGTGTVVNQGTLSMTGARTIAGDLTNEAVLSVLGSQTITGDVPQTSGGSTSSIITDASTFGSIAIGGDRVCRVAAAPPPGRRAEGLRAVFDDHRSAGRPPGGRPNSCAAGAGQPRCAWQAQRRRAARTRLAGTLALQGTVRGPGDGERARGVARGRANRGLLWGAVSRWHNGVRAARRRAATHRPPRGTLPAWPSTTAASPTHPASRIPSPLPDRRPACCRCPRPTASASR
jgi:hypothetical protein